MHGVVVLLLEDVADLAELRERRPAGLGGAGAGNAVALALQLHPFFQNLQSGEGRQEHL